LSSESEFSPTCTEINVLAREGLGHEIETCAPILLRDDDSENPQLGHALDQLEIELVVDIVLDRHGKHPLVHERADRVLDQALFIGELEIHRSKTTGVTTAVVLFTRDLRLHDNPALAAAHREADRVVQLFVRDPAFHASGRRLAFLGELLAEVPGLEIAHGDVVEEISRFRPDTVYCSEDASPYAGRREQRLAEHFDLRLYPGVTVAGLGDLKTYRVFTPYFRAWSAEPRRALEEPPVAAPETRARRALEAWLRDPAPTGSRLSPYLHFGALSPLECVIRAQHKPEFVRQLCWRDFYAQLLRAVPDDFSLGNLQTEGPGFDAWRSGRTGYPLVDAGMRQLAAEGWLPNRVRLVAASFLIYDLELDWRLGAAYFEQMLLDADVASNRGNWLWLVKNRHRILNPTLQAKKFAGYIGEWLHGEPDRPVPIVDHAQVIARRRRPSTGA
jgi:deoxyribodipyrimidine photolyase